VSKIADIISKDMEVNMKAINIRANEDGTFGGQVEVMVNTADHLDQLVQKIKGTHKYIQVFRLDEE
jgi:(p)ppGpp synthase/HD superfamily hydrolase